MVLRACVVTLGMDFCNTAPLEVAGVAAVEGDGSGLLESVAGALCTAGAGASCREWFFIMTMASRMSTATKPATRGQRRKRECVSLVSSCCEEIEPESREDGGVFSGFAAGNAMGLPGSRRALIS